jgi:hypothetical protein
MVGVNGRKKCRGSGNNVSEDDIERKPSKHGKQFTHQWFIKCPVCKRRVGVHQDKARYLQIANHTDIAVSERACRDASVILQFLVDQGPIGSPDGVVKPVCDILNAYEPMHDFRNKDENYEWYWDVAGNEAVDSAERHRIACSMRWRDEQRYNEFKHAVKEIAFHRIKVNIDFNAQQNQWCVLNGDREVLRAFIDAMHRLRYDMDGHNRQFRVKRGVNAPVDYAWDDIRAALEDDYVNDRINEHSKKMENKERMRQPVNV